MYGNVWKCMEMYWFQVEVRFFRWGGGGGGLKKNYVAEKKITDAEIKNKASERLIQNYFA